MLFKIYFLAPYKEKKLSQTPWYEFVKMLSWLDMNKSDPHVMDDPEYTHTRLTKNSFANYIQWR